MKAVAIRIVWKVLCWWEKVAKKYGFVEQVEEIREIKRKIVDYKMWLLKKGASE